MKKSKKLFGLEDRFKVIPFLETEKRLLKRTSEKEINNLEQAFLAIQDVLPDTVFLSDKTLDNLPHSDALKNIRTELGKLKVDTENTVSQWKKAFNVSKTTINSSINELNIGIKEEEKLDKTYKELPSSEGRGVAIFAKACFGHPSPSKQQKLNATTYASGGPDSSSSPRPDPTRGRNIGSK